MQWLAYLVALMFVLLGAGCMVLVAIGLPGGWLLLALEACIEFFVDPLYLPDVSQPTFPPWTRFGIGSFVKPASTCSAPRIHPEAAI